MLLNIQELGAQCIIWARPSRAGESSKACFIVRNRYPVCIVSHFKCGMMLILYFFMSREAYRMQKICNWPHMIILV